jgi:hypothetical protein
VGSKITRKSHGLQDFLFFISKVGCVKRHRLFHCSQGQKLKKVILYDISGCANAVVVSGAAANPNVLGHCYLNVVDVVLVP